MDMGQETEERVNRIKKVLGFDCHESASIPGSTKTNNSFIGQNTKLEVLVNSMAVFAQKGVADTTVQNLLDAAKISRRTFYKYFKNKVDVLENIYKVSIQLLITRFRSEMGAAESLPEVVNRCVDVYFDYHVELGPIIRLMQEEAMRSDSPLYPHRADSQKTIASVFEKELVRLKNDKIDPWVFYALIWAVENASLYLLTKTSCGQENVSRCKNVMRFFVGSLLIMEDQERPSLPLAPEIDSLFGGQA